MARDNPAVRAEAELDEWIASVYDKPLDYVMGCWDWGADETIQMVRLMSPWKERYNSEFGPDVWACKFLDQLGEDIRARAFNGRDAVQPIQNAISSGHGIGKSAMAAWLAKFIMDTRPFCKITVTATTVDQLKNKTWSALGEWHRKSLTAHRFDYRAGRGSLALRHKQFPDWACVGQTCREENSEAFAGQHAANSTSCYIFDEASGIPAKIYEVRMGGLTDGEPMTFDFGNPTKNSGEFYNEFFGPAAHRFRHTQIDSREAQITNKEYIQRLIDDFGIDSDKVRVRVRGLFPHSGSVEFIGADIVDIAMRREVDFVGRTGPLVIGVDVGGGGDEGSDETVIKARMGDDARSWPARCFNNLDTVQVVGQVINIVNEFAGLGIRVAQIYVDANGIGKGVFDQLRALGYPVTGVWASESAADKRTYSRKADEMWGNLKDAIRTRLVLPVKDTEEGDALRTQLTSREYGYTKGGEGPIKLESKKEMKKRGLPSPDHADALALTYAFELAPGLAGLPQSKPTMCITEYDEQAWGNR